MHLYNACAYVRACIRRHRRGRRQWGVIYYAKKSDEYYQFILELCYDDRQTYISRLLLFLVFRQNYNIEMKIGIKFLDDFRTTIAHMIV